MRDKQIEDRLKKDGFKFEFVKELPISSLDAERRAFNVRLDPDLNEKTVHAIQTSIQDGLNLHAVVVVKGEKDTWVLLDGHHRVAALAREKRIGVDAYVVDESDPQAVDFMRLFLNVFSGTGTTDKRELHLQYFLERYPHADVALCADRCGLTTSSITKVMRRRETMTVLEDKSPGVAKSLSKAHVDAMSPLRSKTVLPELAAVVHDAKATSAEVRELVRGITSSPNDAESRERISAFVKEKRKENRAASRTTGEYKKLLGAVRQALTAAKNATAKCTSKAKQFKPDDAAALVAQLDETSISVKELRQALLNSKRIAA